MILLVGPPDDAHVKIVAESLSKRGAPFTIFNTGGLLTESRFSLRQEGARWSGEIRTPAGPIDLEKIRTIWFRRLPPPEFPAGLPAADRVLAYQEAAHILDALWRVLDDRFWVSTPDATRRAESKPYASMVAARAGFRVPETLLTNDPAALKPFYDANGAEVVYKTLSQHSRTGPDQRQVILTTRIREKDLDRAESIAKAPCCFQRLIPKKVEYRVMAIGPRIFACEIQSQGNEKTRVDWRADPASLPHRLVTLPAEVEARCRRVMTDLGLVFGCIDLIETPDGEFHFLEVNPQGNWYWVEEQTGAPLLATLTEMLAAGGV